VITEKVIVRISNVIHVKPLSKQFTVQMDVHFHHTIKVVLSHKIEVLDGENS
jgi:hypothetical protein